MARHVLWDAHRSIHQTRAYIRYLLRQYRSCAPGTFVIALRDTGKVIGTIGFMWVQTENRSAEVGYSLSRAYWNRGFMTEALTAAHCGLPILGLSVITNMAAGVTGAALSGAEVNEAAEAAAPVFSEFLLSCLESL